jgi:CHASE2 domain-containing sensor protein
VPGIFVSYRRDDSFYSVRLLYEHLRRWLPGEAIFLDESDIQAGAQWRQTLEQRLADAGVVLAVIGRQWISLANPETHVRRLDEPDDVVCWEITQGLSGGKRVIPVLIDGAGLPTEDQLPPALKVLARMQYREIGRRSFEGDVQALARALSGTGAAVDPARWIWLVKRSLLTVPIVAAAAVAVGWSNLLDQADVWFQNRTTWIGDSIFDIPQSDRLRVVVLPARATEATGPDHSRRLELARVLDALTTFRPQAVVFDATLEANAPEFDDALASAVIAARNAGVRTVFGFKDLDSAGNPLIADRLRASGAELGVVCVGDRRGGGSNVAFATLAMLRDGRAQPSLSLLAAHDLRRVHLDGLSDASGEVQVDGQRPIPVSQTQTFDVQSPTCPARGPGTSMVRFIPHISNRERLPTRHSLEALSRLTPGAGNPFQGRIVLVGIEQPRDLLYTPLDLAAPRTGFEFQADAIGALLSQRVVRPISALGHAASIILLAAAAAIIRLAGLGTTAGWRRFWSGCALAGYLGIGVCAYRGFDSLWRPVLPMLAFAATWTALSRFERR